MTFTFQIRRSAPSPNLRHNLTYNLSCSTKSFKLQNHKKLDTSFNYESNGITFV